MRHPWISRISLVVLVGVIVLAWHTPAKSAQKDQPKAQRRGAVPKVVDATNKVVGQVIGTDSGRKNPVVALEIPGLSVIVMVTPDQFTGNISLHFTSANCTGQPYINAYVANMPHVFPLVAVGNGILYGPLANSTPVASTASSRLDWETLACTSTSINSLIIADPIIDLNTQFTPPYRFVYP